MAFRQHVSRPQPRLSFPASPQPANPADVAATASPLRKRALEESEEWVLFTPVVDSETRTQTTSTERTTRTAGLSRLSDFGSLDTAAHSGQQDENDDDDNLTQHGSERDDDAEDLDSLDDGLHAFHEPSDAGSVGKKMEVSGQTVLPTHDGFGAFPPSTSMMQDQIRQFERGPRRHVRRRSSVQRRLDALEEQDEFTQDEGKRQWIESWRMEQSKALLEEIERQTRRRRRRSLVHARNAQSRIDSLASTDSITDATRTLQHQTEESTQDEESMSFLQRFTQKVIRDLMGIDESLLSVIFGESLPDEALSTTPTAQDITPDELQREIQKAIDNEESSGAPTDSWQHRLLERIARELGILVHQLSEHPGAFDTYLRTQEPLPYAGLHAPIPENAEVNSPTTHDGLSASGIPFQPTIPTAQSEASHWGVDDHPGAIPIASSSSIRQQQEREYWERDLDAKMIFRFLLQRFTASPPPPSSSTPSHPSSSHNAAYVTSPPFLYRTHSANTTTTQSQSTRAAIIRQHHPLVARRSESLMPTTGGVRRREVGVRREWRRSQGHLRAASSSCASQSAKNKRSGSSRNYWDLGGSVGSASAIGVGTWGEV